MNKRILLVVTATLLILFIAFTFVYFLLIHKKKEPVQVQPVVKAVHTYAYKICTDSLDISYGTVKNNENLSTILSPRIDAGKIDRMVKSCDNVFDVRKIHAGNRYAFLSSRDTTHRTLYFVYEINPIDYVVFDLKDSVKVFTGKKDVERKIREAKGVIYSSLWNAFESSKLDIKLALSLSDVFAWTVDFYGLQKGDNFKVIYEELFVDNVSVGPDQIIAAEFFASGKEYKAFYYNEGGDKGYFDENGQSLQRDFLKAPLHFSRISSRFTRSRFHPILKIFRPHFGVDYAAPRGTPVVAIGDGRVTEAGWSGGFGRRIVIRHNSVYTTSYAHLSGFAKNIHAGASVKQGDVIGFVGSSGLATGPHLDFRVFRNGQPADPLRMESPPTEPVKAANMPKYATLVKKITPQLDSIR